MKEFSLEGSLADMELSVEKARCLAEWLIEFYELDLPAPVHEAEALSFAANRKRIGLGVEMIFDYLGRIRDALSALGLHLQEDGK